MKYLLSIVLSVLFVQAGLSQKGFNVGGNFILINSNIVVQNTWGNGHEYEYAITINTSYGLDVGYNFSNQIGISTGYWLTDLGQNYEDTYDGSDWTRSLTLKYNMIPVLLKFNGTKSKVNFMGAAGVLIASLKEAEQEWLRDGTAYNQSIQNPITVENFNLGETDVTDRFNESDLLVNLEVGARIPLGEKLYMDAVLSFGYGLKDINHEDWHIPDGDGEYDPSHNAFSGLKVGLAYVFSKE